MNLKVKCANEECQSELLIKKNESYYSGLRFKGSIIYYECIACHKKTTIQMRIRKERIERLMEEFYLLSSPEKQEVKRKIGQGVWR